MFLCAAFSLIFGRPVFPQFVLPIARLSDILSLHPPRSNPSGPLAYHCTSPNDEIEPPPDLTLRLYVPSADVFFTYRACRRCSVGWRYLGPYLWLVPARTARITTLSRRFIWRLRTDTYNWCSICLLLGRMRESRPAR